MKKVIDLIAGRKLFQRFFELVHRVSVYAMNYGNGDVRYSGETNTARYVHRKLKSVSNELILFDVGANQGKYTQRLLKVFGDVNVKIHAFEPSPVIYQVLKKNLADIPNVTLHQFGFSSGDEKRTLFKNGAMSGQSSVYNRRLEHFNMKMEMQEDISLTTLDRFCDTQSIRHIHFLKMDVEGHEFACFQGAAGLLSRGAIDFIQFEFGGCNIDARTYFQDFWYLLHRDYRFYRVVKDGLVPIDEYNERWEIFKNINFLLEKRSLNG
jgi:FkbM family methyltransferase